MDWYEDIGKEFPDPYMDRVCGLIRFLGYERRREKRIKEETQKTLSPRKKRHICKNRRRASSRDLVAISSTIDIFFPYTLVASV